MSDVDTALAERLRKAVEASPRKRTEIAHETKIDKSSLTKMLSGERGISIAQLKAITLALGLDYRDFLADEGSAKPSAGPLPDGLAAYLAKYGDRIAPVVRRHLERSHFSTDAGVVLDDRFWAEQTGIWARRLGLPGSGEDSGKSSQDGRLEGDGASSSRR